MNLHSSGLSLNKIDKITQMATAIFRKEAQDKTDTNSSKSFTTRRLTNTALNQLETNIGSLHEIDIFKICVKTL